MDDVSFLHVMIVVFARCRVRAEAGILFGFLIFCSDGCRQKDIGRRPTPILVDDVF